MAALAELRIGVCYEKLGKTEARRAYETVLRDYADQTESAAEARTRMARLTNPVGAVGSGLAIKRLWVVGGDYVDVGCWFAMRCLSP